MAGGIKGITVKIGGDVTGLDKALKGVDKQSKSLQDELKKVDRLLKLDPSNVDLIRQNQELLNEAVSTSREKYEALKKAKDEAERQHAANAEWERQYEPLKKALDEAAKKYDTLRAKREKAEQDFAAGKISADDLEKVKRQCDDAKKGMDDCNQAVKDLDAAFADGHIDDKEYRDFNRRLAEAKNKTEDLEKALKKCNPALDAMAAKAKDAGGKLDGAAKKMAPLSKAAAGVVGALATATQGTKEYREDLSKLETNAQRAGASMDVTKDALRDLNAITGEADSNVEALSNLLQAGFTDNEMQQAVDALSGAVISFPDTLKIESLSDSLQETIATGTATGQFAELLDRLGINTERFDKNLQRASKSGKEQEFILKTLAKTGLAQVNEQYRQTHEALVENSNAQFDLNEAMAQLGAAAEPVLAEITQILADLLGKFAEWFGGLDEGSQKMLIGFTLVLAAISPVLSLLGSLSMGLGAIIPLFAGTGVAAGGAAVGTGALGGALALLTSPVTLVIAAIAALVAAFVYLWNNCEEFRQFWVDLWEALKAAPAQFAEWVAGTLAKVIDAFNRLDDFLQNVFAVDWTECFGAFGEVLNALFVSVSEIWDGIKGVFDGVITFIVGVFTGDWRKAWEGVKMIFKGVWDTLVGIVKMPINGIIGLINMAISGINALISGLNKIQINVPDWVPLLGGKQFGFNVPTIPKIPALAKGGVLSEGMAIIAEAGPELVRMRGGKATVTPLTGSARSAAAAGMGTTINEHYHFAAGSIAAEIKGLHDVESVIRSARNEVTTAKQGHVSW